MMPANCPAFLSIAHPASAVPSHASHVCDATDTALALALLRHLTDSIYLMDPDGRITLVNRAAADELNLDDPHRAQGRHWSQLWPCIDGARLKDALAEAAEGETVRLTLFCPGVRGADKHREVTLCPIEGTDGRTVKILCIARAVPAK
ncbi:MAG TPA: PAS domain-containing protein [Paracoccus sp. (in: a-proteobacteria)]|nr:PAS domain-containing protein [Paracoccus sp. (in: a-proteobacteria)]